MTLLPSIKNNDIAQVNEAINALNKHEPIDEQASTVIETLTAIDDQQWTVLHHAMLAEDTAIAMAIIEYIQYRVEPSLDSLSQMTWLDTETPEGYTPLHFAKLRNNVAAVTYLLKAGADASKTLDNAKTPIEGLGTCSLDQASDCGQIKKLLKASVNATKDETVEKTTQSKKMTSEQESACRKKLAILSKRIDQLESLARSDPAYDQPGNRTMLQHHREMAALLQQRLEMNNASTVCYTSATNYQ